ncbi:MAG TPA: PEGA domain-containing protein, partial [bacterium]|nr:PEGA domain-containing protein [bacterium]
NAAHDEKIPLERGLIVEWQKNPREFQEALKRRQARELFQRGLYLKNQGLSHLDEAIRVLSSAASLDPSNGEAKKHLDELQKTKQDSVVIQRKSVLRRERQRTWIVGIGAGAILVGFLAVGFHFLAKNPGGISPTPAPTATAVAVVSPPPVVAATPAVTAPVPAATTASTPTPVAAKTPKPRATPIAKATAATPPVTPTQVAVAATPPPTPTPPPAAAPASGDQISVVDPEMTHEGFLKLIVKPWAKVYVDGNYVGDTPFPKPLKMSKGPHQIRLVNPNILPVDSNVEIQAGKMLTRTVQLQVP